jgi:hypothetical protein
MWTIHEQLSCDPSLDAICEVPVAIQSLPAIPHQSFGHRKKLQVPEACNTSVLPCVPKLRMEAYLQYPYMEHSGVVITLWKFILKITSSIYIQATRYSNRSVMGFFSLSREILG